MVAIIYLHFRSVLSLNFRVLVIPLQRPESKGDPHVMSHGFTFFPILNVRADLDGCVSYLPLCDKLQIR